MGKKITFNYENEKYTLEFTAHSLKVMSDRGFNFDDLAKNTSVTFVNDVFKGLFIEHHENLSDDKINEIYRSLTTATKGGKSLNEVIINMLAEAINAITMNEGNVEWSLEE